MPLSPTAAETITGPAVGEGVLPGSGDGLGVGPGVGTPLKQMYAPSYATEPSEENEMDDEVVTATPCGPVVPSYSTESTVISSQYPSM